MNAIRKVRVQDYRAPGEALSLAVTLAGLLSLYFLVMLFFFEDLRGSFKTQAIALGALALYLLTVLFQQRSAFGTLVRVSERQFPEIHKLAVQAAERLGVAPVPVYIKRSSEQNIYTLGILGKRIVVIHSAMVDQMSPENLQFFIGREIGHMAGGHTFLRALLKPVGSDAPIVGKALNSIVFGDWWGRAESTADRAGLIACHSLTAAVTGMLKLGVGVKLFEKLDIAEFLEQIHDVRSLGGRVAEIVTVQPYLTKRVRHLSRFAISDGFRALVPAKVYQSEILQALPQTFIQSTGFGRSIAPGTELESPGKFCLETEDAKRHPLDAAITRIGRSSENEIQIDRERISRFHAEILREAGGFLLRDKNSTNGVWLNGERIFAPSRLRAGDRIRIGDQEFLFTTSP